MKRSEIDGAIENAIRVLTDNKITLPMFGYWSKKDWENVKSDNSLIKRSMLGWDVTDFGSDEFEKVGAVLFTARNGDVYDRKVGTPYAEKYILLDDTFEQEIPFHFHKYKTEDIINRGGGVLSIQLYNSLPNGDLDSNNDVLVYLDGVRHIFEAGCTVDISTGNSITLTPGIFHRFFAKKGFGMLILGEVSSINDDRMDNVFLKETERFCGIYEDEDAKWFLANEYL